MHNLGTLSAENATLTQGIDDLRAEAQTANYKWH
jgi:hypothetical protein